MGRKKLPQTRTSIAQSAILVDALSALGVPDTRIGRSVRDIAERIEQHMLKEERLIMPLISALFAAMNGVYDGTNLQSSATSTAKGFRSELRNLHAEHETLSNQLKALIKETEKSEEGTFQGVEVLISLSERITQEEEIVYPAALVIADAILSARSSVTFDICELLQSGGNSHARTGFV